MGSHKQSITSSKTITPYPFPETFKPQYWPVWAGLGLLKFVTALPSPTQTWIGKRLGSLMYLLMKKRRCISNTNLKLVFPELEDDARQALLKVNFQHLGLMLTDTGLSWWASPERLAKHVTITGREHLDKALAENRGVILLTPHMSSLDIGGIILCLHYPVHVMYKRSRNVLAEAIIRRGRERFSVSMFAHKHTRGMFTALKSGEILWYSPDQDFGPKRSVFAKFMGVDTATTPAISRIAAKTGAVVVPYYPVRLQGSQGICVNILPQIEGFPVENDVVDSQTVNDIFEKIVRQHPEQYLWLHRRFKTRPPGEPPIYEEC